MGPYVFSLCCSWGKNVAVVIPIQGTHFARFSCGVIRLYESLLYYHALGFHVFLLLFKGVSHYFIYPIRIFYSNYIKIQKNENIFEINFTFHCT